MRRQIIVVNRNPLQRQIPEAPSQVHDCKTISSGREIGWKSRSQTRLCFQGSKCVRVNCFPIETSRYCIRSAKASIGLSRITKTKWRFNILSLDKLPSKETLLKEQNDERRKMPPLYNPHTNTIKIIRDLVSLNCSLYSEFRHV